MTPDENAPINKDFGMWEQRRFFEIVREMNRPSESLDQQSSLSACTTKSTKVMWASGRMKIGKSLDSLAGYEAQKKEIMEFLSTAGLSDTK